MFVNDNLILATSPLTLGASGVIGTAILTVDINTGFSITASAANLVFTLPSPTNTIVGSSIDIYNSGTNSFTMYGINLLPSKFTTFRWDGINWIASSSTPTPEEIIDVTGVTFPIIFPITTLPGTPVFTPNTPATLGKLYSISDGTQTVGSKWNGTQYISNPLPAIPNVRYGSGTPLVITGTDKKNDTYIQNSTGAFGGTFIAEWVYNGTAWDKTSSAVGNIIAITPFNSAPETVVSFDGFEIKWLASSAATYDGIAIRVISGTRQIKYTSTEFYLASSVHDSGKTLYGSDNTYYNIPNAGTLATLSTPAFPHYFNLTTTFIGMGNPALPNSNHRIIMFKDVTNSQLYRITVYKNSATGEVLATQNGTCEIVVEKMGIATNQILTAGTGIAITSGVISSTIGVGSILNVSTATYAALTTDKTIRLTLAGSQTLTLPTTGLTIGQEYNIVNATGYNKVISSIISLDSNPTVFINSFEGFTVQWDGTNWIKIRSTGESIVQKSRYFAAANWAAGSIIIGNVEFSFNAANIGATTAVQARCVGSTASFASSLHVTRDVGGGLSTNDAITNPSIATTYQALGTAAVAITANYTKVVYRLQDRTSTTLANLGVYEITAQNDGSTNVSLTIKYIKGT
jgi:hypothetical protein